MLYGENDDFRDPLTPISMLLASQTVPLEALTIRGGEENTVSYVDALTQRLAVVHLCAKQAIEQSMSKRQAKNQLVPTTYELGDFVLLLPAHDVKLRKLAPRLLGPFKVVSHRDGQVLYRVQNIVDPSDIRDVHTSRMRPFLPSQGDESVNLADLAHLAAADVDEYIVDSVLAHRGATRDKLEFLLHWKGYPDSEDSWEPLVNVLGNIELEHYLTDHSDVRSIVNSKPRHAVQSKRLSAANKH